MSTIRVEPEMLFPRFILRDRNGKAMAKAICAALNYMYERRQAGIDALYNVDNMPEWRLNELAWEYDLTLDINADIETKRRYMKDIYGCFEHMGTPAGVEAYLAAYFGSANITEWTEYNGTPLHFRLELNGTWSGGGMYQPLATAKKLVEYAKNLRSELDSLTFNETKKLGKRKGAILKAVRLFESSIPGIDPENENWLTNEYGEILLNERNIVMSD